MDFENPEPPNIGEQNGNKEDKGEWKGKDNFVSPKNKTGKVRCG